LSSTVDEVDFTAPDFWQGYLPERAEDLSHTGGISMGDRRRLLRDGAREDRSTTDAEGEPESDSDPGGDLYGGGKPDVNGEAFASFKSSRKKVARLHGALLRFGWGRWREIQEHGQLHRR
jgi:hypothetical protein